MNPIDPLPENSVARPCPHSLWRAPINWNDPYSAVNVTLIVVIATAAVWALAGIGAYCVARGGL
jgi:hypothetical protein